LTQVAVTETKKRERQKITFSEKLSVFALKIFRRPARRIANSMPGLREDILKSSLRTTPDALVALALLITTITTAIASVFVVLAFLFNFFLLALALVASPIALVVGLNTPALSKSSRSYALENELPFMIGYMEVLAGGGVSPISTLRRIAKMDKLLPASSKEAKLVLVDTDVFGVDPTTALEKAANYNPNRTFSEFLYGYTTVLKTGGDAQTYVNSKLKEIMDARSAKTRRTADTIGTLAEAYVTVTAVLGISLFTLYQIQSIVAHNQSGITSILMFSFVVIPLISGVFLWLLDGLGTKQPYLDNRPYKVLAVFGPIGAAFFFIPLPLPLFFHAAIALSLTVFVPSIYAIRYSRERSGLEKALPEFIRDVAESRKIGLSPESSIEELSSKGYGRLSKPIKKMGAQLSWGLSLSKVVATFIDSVHSWLTKVAGSLMLEVVDVGGGTVRSFSEMADFTRKINDLESEKRSSLKPYLFVIYMAALMIVLTTFLMVYFLTSTTLSPAGSLAASSVDPNTVELLLVSTLFESWVVGFVAGKMGEGSISDGFKHSFLLVVMSLVTIFIASSFINIPY
jgi:archaeal flagellar protein FlaJ